MSASSQVPALLAAKLLGGWTLLNETCVACNPPTALVRKGSTTLCVLCARSPDAGGTVPFHPAQPESSTTGVSAMRDISREEAMRLMGMGDGGATEIAAVTAPRAPAAPASTAAPAAPAAPATQRGLTASRAQRRDEASSKIGELLMEGWTMTADECQRCGLSTPLMAHRGGAPLCVVCDLMRAAVLEEGDSNEIDDIIASLENEDVSQWRRSRARAAESPREDHAPAAEDAAPRGEAVSQSDVERFRERERSAASASAFDPSREMGQRLLQGFALLEEQCPLCDLPLMRQPQRIGRNVLCVRPRCAAALPEADSARGLQQRLAEAARQPSPRRASAEAPAALVAPSAAPFPEAEAPLGELAERGQRAMMTSMTQLTARLERLQAGAGGGGGGLSVRELEELSAITAAIGSCAESLRSVVRLRKGLGATAGEADGITGAEGMGSPPP